jgi:hypothetical protein
VLLGNASADDVQPDWLLGDCVFGTTAGSIAGLGNGNELVRDAALVVCTEPVKEVAAIGVGSQGAAG